MCGIFGKIYKDEIQNHDRERFEASLDLMQHRGPDDYDTYFGSYVSLGHRRLSIIDLTPGGRQPFHSHDSKIHIVFNGEIYNYLEIKEELKNKGYRFRTQSDTEVLIKLYQEEGIECLSKIIGMFAFALHDERSNTSFLVRDRLGIKPLYYFIKNGDLTFSSEIKSILNFEKNQFEPNEKAISSYMSFRYPILSDSFFKEIYAIPGGYYMKVKDGESTLDEYWNPAKFFANQKTFKTEVEELKYPDKEHSY